MLTKSRLIQILVMLCLLIGLFVWRTMDSSVIENNKVNDALSNQKNGQNINKMIDDISLQNGDSICDFPQPCIVNSLLGEFSLAVEGGQIIPEQWFQLTLTSQLKNWKVKSAKIVGKTMFMGKIPVNFSSPINTDGQLISNAKSMLGICTEDRMWWQLQIVVDVNGQPINIHYDFLIVK